MCLHLRIQNSIVSFHLYNFLIYFYLLATYFSTSHSNKYFIGIQGYFGDGAPLNIATRQMKSLFRHDKIDQFSGITQKNYSTKFFKTHYNKLQTKLVKHLQNSILSFAISSTSVMLPISLEINKTVHTPVSSPWIFDSQSILTVSLTKTSSSHRVIDSGTGALTQRAKWA